MAYQRGASLAPARIIAQYQQDVERARQAAQREAKAAKQEAAQAALRANMEAAKALNIPPHPDGWKHRMELERELSIYHKRKRAS